MEKIFSMPLGGELSLRFYLDQEGKPISAEGNKPITDESLLVIIGKYLAAEEEKSAFTLRIGSDVLKYIFLNDTPVYAGSHQPIQDSTLLKAIETDRQRKSEQGKIGALRANNIADNFKGLPMRELIGGPLFAAAESQEKLASIAWDYYQKLAYDTKDDGTPDTEKTRLLKFELERPIVQGGVVSSENNKVKVSAPFIGLVPIPSLLIDRIDIDFQMEVTETNTHKDQSDESLSTDISSKWFGVNVGISGKVSSSRENTRSSNQTAKYQVHVTASQQRQSEGLSKLMDIMAACIEPIPANAEK